MVGRCTVVRKFLLLAFLLCGCANAASAQEGVVDLCAIDSEQASGPIRVRSTVEADGHHGMYLSSMGCRFKLRVGQLSEDRHVSVDRFLSHVSSGARFNWRKYDADISGRVVHEESSRARFEMLRVHSFQDSVPSR